MTLTLTLLGRSFDRDRRSTCSRRSDERATDLKSVSRHHASLQSNEIVAVRRSLGPARLYGAS